MNIDEKEYSSKFGWRIWKRLLPFLAPYKGELALNFAVNILIAVTDVFFPLLRLYAIDEFIGKGQTDGVLLFGVLYGALTAFQSLLVALFFRVSTRIEMNFGKDLRRAQFVHLQKLSLGFYNATPVGYLLARTMNDTERLSGLISWNLADLLWALLYMIGSYVAMLFLNWRLALLVLVVVPVIALATAYFQKRILFWNRKVRKTRAPPAPRPPRPWSSRNRTTMPSSGSPARWSTPPSGRPGSPPSTSLSSSSSAPWPPLLCWCGVDI